MKHLVGRRFTLAAGNYRIVDVQRLGNDALVYAERTPPDEAAATAAPGAPAPRTAFRIGDIAALLGEAPVV